MQSLCVWNTYDSKASNLNIQRTLFFRWVLITSVSITANDMNLVLATHVHTSSPLINIIGRHNQEYGLAADEGSYQRGTKSFKVHGRSLRQ